VTIVELNQRLGGAVVLVNPDASEIKLPIANLNIKENVMEFETRDKDNIFYWSLTLRRNPDRGLLHGSRNASRRTGTKAATNSSMRVMAIVTPTIHSSADQLLYFH
jgi:hypothetical protein